MPDSEQRNCQNCKQSFTIDAEDFAFYEKMQVPPPTFCWLCRTQRRYILYTETALYKRPDSRTGEQIFSHFSERCPIKVYEHDYWWSDKWDSMEYGRDYDFSKPFFEQFKELFHTIPLCSRSIKNLVRSDYSNKASDLKDCYLVFNTSFAERTFYGDQLTSVNDCFDVNNVSKSELCYNSFMLRHCFKVYSSVQCSDSQDLLFCKNCENCTHCIGCVDLRGKKYHIFNKPYSKEEYEEEKERLGLNTYTAYEKFRERAKMFWAQFPIKFFDGHRTISSVGNYISNVKNVRYSQRVSDAENVKYGQHLVMQTKDTMDYAVWGYYSELIYECIECGDHSSRLKFCFDCWPGAVDLTYCIQCHSSRNLFGCIALRNKQYCIFNKQYSKEEYEKLVPKIIRHMGDMPYKDAQGRVYRYGEFFPPDLSPYSYNETLNHEFFPLSKEEAIAQGYTWRDWKAPEYKVTLRSSEIPDSIVDVTEDILKQTIECSHQGTCDHRCGGAFRIVGPELKFYREYSLSLPRLCPSCRFFARVTERTKLQMYTRTCQCAGEKSENGVYVNNSTNHASHGSDAKCPNEFETSYGPDREDIVYCEQCYQAEVL